MKKFVNNNTNFNCIFNPELRIEKINCTTFPFDKLNKKIDFIINSNNFIENFLSVMHLLGFDPDLNFIKISLLEKDYKIISSEKIIIYGLSGFKNVILFINNSEEKILNEKSINRLTATYFHEKCHNIVRKLMGNEYMNSPRGKKIDSKLEAGYLGEILLFGGLIKDEEIKTDLTKLDSKEIDAKVYLLNDLNIFNSGIKCCSSIPFIK